MSGTASSVNPSPIPSLSSIHSALPATPTAKPSQIKFVRAAQMALFARVTTYPPLGHVTVVPPSRKQFNFTVIVESSQSLPKQPWEVSIWYDHGSYSYSKSPWKSLELQKVDHGPNVLFDQRTNTAHRYTFEGHLPSPFPDNGKTYKGRKVPFTVRYRTGPATEWQWVSHNFGVKDGEVILQPPIDDNYLGAGPVELKSGWHARKLASESPGAKLYVTESSAVIPSPNEGEPADQHLTLGHITSPCRWFALVRIWSPWLAPRHGEKHFHLAEPAILLSFLRADGQHVVILAVNGVDDCLTTFKSDDAGNIVVCSRNDTGRDRKFKVLAATAWSFEVANSAVMYEMRKQVLQSSAYQHVSASLIDSVKTESVDSDTVLVSTEDNRNPADDDTPVPQWLASWYDSLAYCTWNSLGQDLNAEKIMNGLESLAKNNIHIANLIIDDNWQSVTGEQGSTSQFHRAWTDFEANSQGFPGGLKVAIDKIRAAHPRIRDIAVWHALMGYWGGVSSDTGHLHKDYKLREIELSGTVAEGKKYVVDPIDIHRMYDDFYTFLTECGITAVKTDVQFYLDLIASSKDRHEMITLYQSAWTQAHLRHLSGKAISCMSQIPQILYHSFLPTNTPRIMLRNSDDFFPDVPSSHPWHVFTNAHSALFVQHLNVLPDWDMFQTSHPYSGFHAAARCISGGPIYITDTPGEHNVELIHEMTAINPRGDTVVLRPSNVGKTLGVYEKYDDGAILKVGVYDGRAEVGTGMLAIFNIAEKEASIVVPISKIPGVIAIDDEAINKTDTPEIRKKWIVRSHQSRLITKAITPTAPPRGESLLEATLPIRGYDIWSAIPVHGPFDLTSTNGVEVAVVGLLGKMTGACAIVESRFGKSDNGDRLRIDVSLKALGVLGLWISDAASRKIEDLMVIIKGQVIPQERVEISTEGVQCAETSEVECSRPGLIEIDVEGAWNDLKLDAGWNNEVGVEIFIS